jgi:hypothetical protein
MTGLDAFYGPDKIGTGKMGELMVRLFLIYNTSPATVLVVSPMLLGTLTIVTMIWAFSYGKWVRLRAMARLNQVVSPRIV